MIVEKRFNNNIVLADDGGQKVILMGKGIGFKAYPGNLIDATLIERKFISTDTLDVSDIAQLLTDTSLETVEFTEKIIKKAEEIMEIELNPSILFSLQDHINFAVHRYKEDLIMESPIQWEVNKFYPKEAQAGKEAVQMINQYYDIELPSCEATFITLHFVNNQMNQATIQDTVEIAEIIRSILQIVQYHFQTEIKEDTISYNRFLTHLRYYLLRQKTNQFITFENGDLYYTVKDRFPKESECVDKIAHFLNLQFQWRTSNDEKLYLILHLRNLVAQEDTSI